MRCKRHNKRWVGDVESMYGGYSIYWCNKCGAKGRKRSYSDTIIWTLPNQLKYKLNAERNTKE